MLAGINKWLTPLGVQIVRPYQLQGFALHRYTRADGSFDYERYRAVQTDGNRKKLAWTFASEQNIDFLAAYLKQRVPAITFGLCHGTRRGLEQRWFAERLGCEVVGTEISDTATEFPNTIQWDFHEVKPEWAGAVDFIYSNAFDHSYDPELCLNRWMSCLRPAGLCLIEHSAMHAAATFSELDPFGADLSMMPFLIAKWAKGRYALVDLLEAPRVNGASSHFLCVRNVA